MKQNLNSQVMEFAKQRLSYYNNFSFIRDVEPENLFLSTIELPLKNNLDNKGFLTYVVDIEGQTHYFLVKELKWDSEFFELSCYSIDYIFFKHYDLLVLQKAIQQFIEQYVSVNSYYTINVATEDLILIQALSATRFRLIETRLNYAHKIDRNMQAPGYSDISLASECDIEILRNVAYKMRNPYDRVHADTAFDNELADSYLAKFIEESVKGFADIVLKVVDNKGIPFGFLAGNNPIDVEGKKVSRLVLAAVDSSVQKGRLEDLLMEMIYRVKLEKAEYLTTITQTSNIPAIRTWEKTNFKMFKVTHLYSLKK